LRLRPNFQHSTRDARRMHAISSIFPEQKSA
jgi:hypothetical protein